MAKPMKEVFTPASFEAAMKVLAEEFDIEKMEEKDISKSRTLELELYRKDGSIVPVETKHSFLRDPDGQLIEILTIARDITERKQAEKRLIESEAKFRAIFEQAAESIVLVDAETGALVEFNEQACLNLGYSPEEFGELKIPDFEIIESTEEVKKHIQKIVKEGSSVFETRHRTKDGEIRDIWVSSRAIKIGGRDFAQSVWRDITERKQMEEALRESEERIQTIVSNAPVVIWSLDKEGIFTLSEGAGLKALGLRPGEAVGQSIFDVYHDVPKILEANRRVLAGETFVSIIEVGELVFESHYSPIRDKSGEVTGMVGVSTDITERKQAEERERRLQQELYLSSRLASIGQLAAGVAHQINNPLTGILGFSERLLRKSTDKEATKDLERIHSEAARTAKIIQSLLTFARHHKPKKEYADINDILQKALELRAYELKTGNIEVALDLAPALPQTIADFHQIEEVFLNLILNAEQAMIEAHQVGKLSIKTRQTKDYIKISLADDGPGIPAEHLDRLFDPFFTTREVKGGTGLGLSICHGIVTEHEGKIYAKSKSGKGSTFFVELPVTTAKTDKGK